MTFDWGERQFYLQLQFSITKQKNFDFIYSVNKAINGYILTKPPAHYYVKITPSVQRIKED